VSASRRHLIAEDGTPFFWLGDTAWKIARLTPEDVDRYMENRASKGFTVIQMNLSGANPNYAGEAPFLSSGPPWSSVRPNESYWRHVDYIIQRARKHGMYVAAFAWWGDAADNSFAQPELHNYQYGKALGARYADQPHIIWVGAGEYHKPNMWTPPVSEGHVSRLIRLVEGIRDGDTGHHLITMHPLSFLSSSEEFHDEEWLDFNMVQTHVHPDYIDHLLIDDWNRIPAKPTLNAEPWYEG
jgi:hypothetical protein